METNLEARPQFAWMPALFGILAIVAGIAVGMIATQSMVAAIAIIAGLIGAVAITINLDLGLAALIFITYTLFSDVLVSHGAPSVAKLLVPFLLVVVLLRWIIYHERPMGWEQSAFLVMLYGMVGVASLLYANDTARTQLAIIDYLKDAVIAVVVTLLLRRTKSFHVAVWALLVAGIFMATLTTYQYLRGAFDNSYWGFAIAKAQGAVGHITDYRIGGPVGDPNIYSQILVVLVPVALDRLWSNKRAPERFIAGWGFAAISLSIIFSFSRGGFLALIVVLGLMFVRVPPRPIIIITSIAVIMAILRFIPASYTDRLATLLDAIPGVGPGSDDPSIQGRANEMAVGWQLFLDHPFFGVGWENYPTYYQEYSRLVGVSVWRREDRQAHSLYLQIAAESGVMGLGIFAVLMWVAFAGLRRAHHDFKQAALFDSASMAVALGIGLIGYLVAAFFLHAAYPRYFWLLYGLALAAPQIAKNERAALGHFIATSL